MQILVLYFSTALLFLAADAVALRLLMRPVFERHVGEWLLDTPRLGAAAVFYLFYVAGVVWFVSLPALRADAPVAALRDGALLGAIAYGTYEMTNYATLKGWSLQQVAVDWLWGTALTAASAFVSVLVARSIA
ncbi:DUF2177 family protein [Tranquillimonas alkanivorans]|uniref:Uncharacterized membrane protein n=1 Tax=Tranquillimonas alkanivorans TaxID=441119 RepID=A0A1I5KGF9_9RHOB|nr:DUF2177 family protein [Tranquillimonas alkanivorans]SFO83721.1 Uncharacterized membrane protein [Tranquillimonas alkanivorans]